MDLRLVAGELDATGVYGFCESTPDKAQCRGGSIAFRLERKEGGFPGEFIAPIELQAGVFQKFCRKTHVPGSIHSPEPQLFLVALQEVQRLLELLHGAVK